MQGIVIETRERSPGIYVAEVVDGPEWALMSRALHPARYSAYHLLCTDLRARWRGPLEFIHVPEWGR